MYLKINDSEINYLIHGQDLNLEYESPGAWFLIFSYRRGNSKFRKISFRSSKGVLTIQANSFDPVIKIWKFKWTLKLEEVIKLNVNFINACELTFKTKYLDYKPLNVFHLKKLESTFSKIDFQGKKPHLPRKTAQLQINKGSALSDITPNRIS